MKQEVIETFCETQCIRDLHTWWVSRKRGYFQISQPVTIHKHCVNGVINKLGG